MLNEVIKLNEVMGRTLIRYDLLSLQEEEIRAQTGTEGDQKGGCLPAKERGLRRKQPCDILTLDIQPSDCEGRRSRDPV